MKEDELLGRVARELLGVGVDGWLVGGALRDALLGRPGPPDLDLIVPEGAFEVSRRLAASLGGSFVALDEARQIARIALAEGTGARDIDVASLRAPTVEEDLMKRDFTVNAMAVSLKDLASPGELEPAILDPAGGREDLRERLIRVPSPSVLEDDPLRLLRAVRLAAELGFSIHPETREAVRSRADRLESVAGERIRDELFSLLEVEPAWGWVEETVSLGLMAHLAPEYLPMVDLDQGRHHEATLWRHSVSTLRHLEVIKSQLEVEFAEDAAEVESYLAEAFEAKVTRKALMKWAALWHDVGKPATRTVERDGEVRFLGHEQAGADLMKAMAGRLRLGRRSATFLTQVVANHLRPLHLSKAEAVTRRACYRFFRDLREASLAVCLVALADARATREGGAVATDVEGVVSALLAFRREREAEPIPPLVDGWELMARFGLEEGPLVGRLLSMVEEARAMGEVETREEALAYLEERRGEWGEAGA